MKNETMKKFKEEIWDVYISPSGFTEYLSDIIATKDVLVLGLGTAFLIGFVYMFVLRFFAGPIIYCSIILIISGTSYGGWMLYQRSLDMPDSD